MDYQIQDAYTPTFNLTIVTNQNSNWAMEQTYQMTTAFLKESVYHDQILICASDRGALGCFCVWSEECSLMSCFFIGGAQV